MPNEKENILELRLTTKDPAAQRLLPKEELDKIQGVSTVMVHIEKLKPKYSLEERQKHASHYKQAANTWEERAMPKEGFTIDGYADGRYKTWTSVPEFLRFIAERIENYKEE